MQHCRRILVVDDDESLRRSVRAYLEDEGFEVSDAESGETALEILGRDQIAAAIVDIRLSGMDGNAFTERAHQLHPGLGFLLMTGSVDYHPPERLVKLGVSDAQVFYKPINDMTLLIDALETILQAREQHE
ncbi:MAG: response regulator [Syntrophobacteraceae bacterium]